MQRVDVELIDPADRRYLDLPPVLASEDLASTERVSKGVSI